MSRNTWIIACSWAAFLALVAASANATVTVYTNRTAWEANLTLPVVTEDFEAEVQGNHPTPFTTTTTGTVITTSDPNVVFQIFNGGIVNGTQELHFRDFTAGVKFLFSPVGKVGFGFDYYASDGPGAHSDNLPWILTAGGVATPLVPDLISFVGYIDDTGSLKEFTLTGPTGPQGGVSLDNLSVGAAAAQPSTCVSPPNTTMVAWYPFDETTGTLSANLATANTGVKINSPTSILGMVGRALRFNGINNYVESPSSIVTNIGPADFPPSCSGGYSTCQGNFSIDAWIRVDPAAASLLTVILDKRSGSAPAINGYHLFVFNGALGLQLADGIGSGNSNYFSPKLTPPLTDGNWHYIAVTVRRTAPSGISWYHNGTFVGSSNPTDRLGSLKNNSPLRIGTRTADLPLTGWFHGDIDELEIYNRALTPQEVASIFQAGTFGKCK
jgi:hypothetical protein